MCSAGFREPCPHADVPHPPGREVLGKQQLPSPGPNHPENTKTPARPSCGLRAVTVPHWDGLRARSRREPQCPERPGGHVPSAG